MSISVNKKIQVTLQIADCLLFAGLVAFAFCYPPYLMSTQGYVAAVAWYFSIILVGGQNPAYLRPRYRILISMGLTLFMTAAIGIVWAGSGWNWYMKGGLLSLVLLAIGGTVVRFIVAHFVQQPTLQVVPFRIPDSYRPLLAELARQPHVHVEAEIDDPSAPLPARRSGYAAYLIAGDLRLREGSFDALMPLFATAEVVDLCDLYEEVLGKAALIREQGAQVLLKAFRSPSPIRIVLKRVFDVFFVLITAPLSLPLLLLAALAVKLTSDGPIFFTQQRLGRHGKPFNLVKLRTMVVNAEALGQRWSGAGDPRVTLIGRLLRASGIDELPQLWNVLCGELSLVGPRPECPSIAAHLTANVPLYRARLLVDPGMTGWAQLRQGSDVDLADVGNKLAYDLYYMQYNSLILDCRILIGTIQMLLHMAKPAPKQAPAMAFSTSKV